MKRLHRRLLTIAAAALLLPGIAPAAPRQKTVVDISRTISDESIIFPESFETNTQKLLEGWYMKNYTATDDRYSKLPDVPVSDEVLIKRYESVRRPHPLQRGNRLIDGILEERDLLKNLKEHADIVIDTSALSIHQLSTKLYEGR